MALSRQVSLTPSILGNSPLYRKMRANDPAITPCRGDYNDALNLLRGSRLIGWVRARVDDCGYEFSIFFDFLYEEGDDIVAVTDVYSEFYE